MLMPDKMKSRWMIIGHALLVAIVHLPKKKDSTLFKARAIKNKLGSDLGA